MSTPIKLEGEVPIQEKPPAIVESTEGNQSCGICGLVERADTQDWIYCDNCQAWYHDICEGVNVADYVATYTCKKCLGTPRTPVPPVVVPPKAKPQTHEEDGIAKKRRGRKKKLLESNQEKMTRKQDTQMLKSSIADFKTIPDDEKVYGDDNYSSVYKKPKDMDKDAIDSYYRKEFIPDRKMFWNRYRREVNNEKPLDTSQWLASPLEQRKQLLSVSHKHPEVDELASVSKFALMKGAEVKIGDEPVQTPRKEPNTVMTPLTPSSSQNQSSQPGSALKSIPLPSFEHLRSPASNTSTPIHPSVHSPGIVQKEIPSKKPITLDRPQFSSANRVSPSPSNVTSISAEMQHKTSPPIKLQDSISRRSRFGMAPGASESHSRGRSTSNETPAGVSFNAEVGGNSGQRNRFDSRHSSERRSNRRSYSRSRSRSYGYGRYSRSKSRDERNSDSRSYSRSRSYSHSRSYSRSNSRSRSRSYGYGRDQSRDNYYRQQYSRHGSPQRYYDAKYNTGYRSYNDHYYGKPNYNRGNSRGTYRDYRGDR